MSKKHNAIIEIIHDSRECGDYLGKILGKIIADYCVGELYILSKADPDDVILDIFDYIDNITYPPQWNETIYFFNNTSEIYEMSKFEQKFHMRSRITCIGAHSKVIGLMLLHCARMLINTKRATFEYIDYHGYCKKYDPNYYAWDDISQVDLNTSRTIPEIIKLISDYEKDNSIVMTFKEPGDLSVWDMNTVITHFLGRKAPLGERAARMRILCREKSRR